MNNGMKMKVKILLIVMMAKFKMGGGVIIECYEG